MTISFSSASAPSKEYSEFKCLKIDWFYLLSVHGIFSNLLQHHSLKASILWHSAFFIVQLPQPYMTTGKIIALTIRTFVGRVMSLLFNTLSRFVIAFLPRSNCPLISWPQSLSSVILEPKKGNLSLLPFFPFYLTCSNGAARRSKQSILKEISPGCSLEGLMLKLKTPILWLPDAKS